MTCYPKAQARICEEIRKAGGKLHQDEFDVIFAHVRFPLEFVRMSDPILILGQQWLHLLILMMADGTVVTTGSPPNNVYALGK